MENFISFAATSVLSGGLGAAAVVWLAKAIISERLKEAIKHEYSSKLESHKTDLGLKVQGLEHRFQENVQVMRHQNEVNQLRTSLFFEPQRTAFAELSTAIAWANEQWWRNGYESDIGFTEPPSLDNVSKIKSLYRQHRLFLDAECVMGMEFLLECYSDSRNISEDTGEQKSNAHDILMASFCDVSYVQPLLVELFQSKMGISSRDHSAPTIAMLGAVRKLNNCTYRSIKLPVTGSLKALDTRPAQAVALAKLHRPELVARLQQLHMYLNTKSFFQPELEAQVSRFLVALREVGTRDLLEAPLRPYDDLQTESGEVS